jgi:hypothetical protein
MSDGLNQRAFLARNRLSSTRLGKTVAGYAMKLGGWVARKVARQRPGQKSLAAYRGELNSAAGQLRQAGGELEKDFLATFLALEKLTGHGESFVQASEQLVGSATGRTGGSTLLFAAMRTVEEPLNFLDGVHPKTQRVLERLQQDSHRIDELISVQTDLQRTIGPLKYIQTLFKIESAPFGGDVQAMFGALTKEIETLHDQIFELFTTRFLELRATQGTVNKVIDELQKQTDSLSASITKGKAKIENSLQELQSGLLENQARESHISQLSKQLNQQIQAVVIGLQFQDIINQKLEHAFAALARIEAQLDSETADAALGQSCRLEAGQLQAVREDLAQAETTIKTGIATMLENLVSADSKCLTLSDYNHLTTSSDGMVQVLFETFATLREEVAATAVSTASAFAQLRAVGGLASNLTQVVRELSQRIHLIGLNAQLQAAQVAAGLGLEVLSARTSEISRATNQISKAVAEKLDQLVRDLGEDVKSLENLNAEAVQQQAKLAQEGAATEHSLHALRDGALNSLSRISSLMEDIRTESQALIVAVNYVGKADGVLAALEETLRDLARTAGDADARRDSSSGALVEQAHRGYTMASERDVFARVVGGQPPATASQEAQAVELFEAPATTTPVATASTLTGEAAEPPPTTPTLEPVSAPHPNAPPPTEARNGHPPPANLGANVELF